MFDQHCLSPDNSKAEYLYCASLPAAIVFSVLFDLTTIAHVWQAIHYRKTFCWVVILGSLWEFIGLVTRALSTLDQSKRTYFLASSPMILLAPVWINAYVYMCLGRTMHYFLPDGKVWGIRAERVTLTFVCGDIIAFCVQGAGGGSSVSSNMDTVRRGLWVYTAGVVLQQVFIFLFFGVAVSLHTQLKQKGDTGRETSWRVLLWTLYVVLVLITIRIIYRIVEFSMGYTNYVTTHEVFYYVFDALPMFFALVALSVWHPAKILVGEGSEFDKSSGGGWYGWLSSGMRGRRRGAARESVERVLIAPAPGGGYEEVRAEGARRAPSQNRAEQGYGHEMVPPLKSHPRGV